jgi:MFS superfamily sulfate permease-like transporter
VADAVAAQTDRRDSWISASVVWRETVAGATAGAALLPSAIAAGVIAFAPLGHDYATSGLAAALVATIFGGLVMALVSTSSFIVSFPLPSKSAVQASMGVTLLAMPAFAQQPTLLIPAYALCVLIAGVFVVLMGVTGLGRIIKFTPHPVLAGFKNGISLTIIGLQLTPFLDWSFRSSGPLPFIRNPGELLAVGGLVALIFVVARALPKVPASLAVIVLGGLAFHAARAVAPGLDLGPTVGAMSFALPPAMPVFDLSKPETQTALIQGLPVIVQFAGVLALLGTLFTLLTYRIAQNLDDVPVKPRRDLVSYGLGSLFSALFGGTTLAGASMQSVTAFQAGGRTRLVTVSMCVLLLALVLLAPGILGALPLAAISAVVIHIAIQTIDPWSISLFRRAVRTMGRGFTRREAYDLGIVAAVMFVTAGVAVLPGVAVGIVLACLVFIVNMSRPLIHQRILGSERTSKRVRSLSDTAYVRETGSRREILELSGVLFFGNADALADEVTRLFPTTDVILLDCRGVTDIDASGAAILRTLVDRARKQHRTILFCNVPTPFVGQFAAIAKFGGQPDLLNDLDTALEWMEERALAARPTPSAAAQELTLAEHGFVRGLSFEELATFEGLLERKVFPAGTTLAREGDVGDRMWLLMRGSVSVRIDTPDPGRGGLRLASLAPGTTVGEMALIECGIRTASIIANEDVVALELQDGGYRELLAEHPAIATKLFGNLLMEMAARIRASDIDLRQTVT